MATTTVVFRQSSSPPGRSISVHLHRLLILTALAASGCYPNAPAESPPRASEPPTVIVVVVPNNGTAAQPQPQAIPANGTRKEPKQRLPNSGL